MSIVAVTVIVAVTTVLITNCDSLSVSEFTEIVGVCGQSLNEQFISRADALTNEFPWNAQLFFTFGKSKSIASFTKTFINWSQMS